MLISSISMAQLREIPDSWTVKDGTYEDKPIIVKKNSGLDMIQGREFYKVRTGIAFKLKSAENSGMPDQDENFAFYDLEDVIFEIFQRDNNAIVSLIITTNGIREFVIYSRSNEWSEECYQLLKRKGFDYNFTTYNEQDPEWSVFEEY